MGTVHIARVRKVRWLGAGLAGVLGLMAGATEARADCSWSVSGTVKVETQQELLGSKFGPQIALKGIKVKVSGATVGDIFDSWGEVTTDSKGQFTLRKDKSCEDRKLKIEAQFQNNSVTIRDNAGAGVVPSVPWYTIIKDSEKRRQAGAIQIVPTVFAAGKNHDLANTTARQHADIWVMANTMRDHLAGYGAQFKYKNQTIIKYPNNELIAPDSREASFTHPVTHVVNIFKSGSNDHMNPKTGVSTLYHEMMHAWVFEHSTAELDLATNLIATGSTHCFNDKEHISFHEAMAEFGMERLMEEIFGPALAPHTLPFNRDALNSGLECENKVDKITTMLQMEQHEFGWLSLLRMLTTNQLSTFTYAGNATSTNRLSSSVFISKTSGAFTCLNPTSFTLKNILDVFLEHPKEGFSQALGKSEMNIDSFMERSSKILKFEAFVTALTGLLNPAAKSEPKDQFCGLTQKQAVPAPTRTLAAPARGVRR